MRPPDVLVRTGTTLVTLALLSLAGCASEREEYCSEVAEHQEELSEIIGDAGPTALLEALPHFRQLAEKAPSDITDEWGVVTDRIGALQQALEAADVDPESYDPENPPENVTGEERRRISRAAARIADDALAEALGGVQQQALDVCENPLYR